MPIHGESSQAMIGVNSTPEMERASATKQSQKAGAVSQNHLDTIESSSQANGATQTIKIPTSQPDIPKPGEFSAPSLLGNTDQQTLLNTTRNAQEFTGNFVSTMEDQPGVATADFNPKKVQQQVQQDFKAGNYKNINQLLSKPNLSAKQILFIIGCLMQEMLTAVAQDQSKEVDASNKEKMENAHKEMHNIIQQAQEEAAARAKAAALGIFMDVFGAILAAVIGALTGGVGGAIIAGLAAAAAEAINSTVAKHLSPGAKMGISAGLSLGFGLAGGVAASAAKAGIEAVEEVVEEEAESAASIEMRQGAASGVREGEDAAAEAGGSVGSAAANQAESDSSSVIEEEMDQEAEAGALRSQARELDMDAKSKGLIQKLLRSLFSKLGKGLKSTKNFLAKPSIKTGLTIGISTFMQSGGPQSIAELSYPNNPSKQQAMEYALMAVFLVATLGVGFANGTEDALSDSMKTMANKFPKLFPNSSEGLSKMITIFKRVLNATNLGVATAEGIGQGVMGLQIGKAQQLEQIAAAQAEIDKGMIQILDLMGKIFLNNYTDSMKQMEGSFQALDALNAAQTQIISQIQ